MDNDSDSSFEEIRAEDHSLTQCPPPQETTTQKIKNLLTNSLYTFEGLTSSIHSFLGDQYEHTPQFYLHGEKIHSKAQTVEKMSRTMWFTYRNNFPSLLNRSQISDAGWGCMIRVGQMFLAEMLRRFQQHRYKEENLFNILSAFLDNDESRGDSINYSIQKIVRIGHEEFRLKPGTWLTPSHVAHILEQIHSIKPLRGYEDMKLVVFNNNTIFYQQMLNQMGYKMCICHNPKLNCAICHKPPERKVSLAIILLSRVGLEIPQEEYKRTVMDLLTLPQSVGIIGGKPNRALYFIGREGMDRLIYLDPHYVQESTSRKNLESLKDTFFCNSYRTIEYRSIDPSLGFGFYIRDLKDLSEFYTSILDLSKTYRDDFFIYSQLRIPAYIKKELSEGQEELQVRRNKTRNILSSSQALSSPGFEI